MTAATVDEYLEKLPEDRRTALAAVRDTITANLPDGYVEGILYNMPAYYVPLERSGKTYNGQPVGIVGFASQKQYMALYLMAVYMDPLLEKWFKAEYKEAGKKLDMGKSCLRFKKLDDLALDVIAETMTKVSVDKLLADYEAVRKPDKKPNSPNAIRAAKHEKTKKPAKKKSPAKKSTPKKSKSKSTKKKR